MFLRPYVIFLVLCKEERHLPYNVSLQTYCGHRQGVLLQSVSGEKEEEKSDDPVSVPSNAKLVVLGRVS